MEDRAEIHRMHRAEKMPIKAIVRQTRASRNAVRRALAADRPPRYEWPGIGRWSTRSTRRSVSCSDYGRRAATVIAERIGWAHSLTVLKDRVRVLRPLFIPPDPGVAHDLSTRGADAVRLVVSPVDVPLGAGQVGRPPVLVMVSGYSRWISALLLPSRQGPDPIAGHWWLLSRFGKVPRALVCDNESAVRSWRSGWPKLTGEFEAFRGMLGVRVVQCRPRDPEAKGLVDPANGYLETSFLPGRSFESPTDFHHQLQGWLITATRRQHRRLGCRPVDRLEVDLAARLSLPPVAPIVGWRTSLRLPHDHDVRVASNDYPVGQSAVGRRVDLVADLETVTITCDGRQVGSHARCWAAHQTITDLAHALAGQQLRHHLQTRAPVTTTQVEQIEQRQLSDDNAVFASTLTASRLRRWRDGCDDQDDDRRQQSRALKAPTLREAVERLGPRAREESWSHEELLVACLQREVSARESHGGEGRIRAARSRRATALEKFDFDHARGLKRDPVVHLGTLDFFIAKDNVLLLGPPGIGKNHLATGLDPRVRGRAPRPVRHRLALGGYPLLMIDEVAYIPFEPQAANLFFQLVPARYERASLIITSNKPFERWGEVFGDDVSLPP